MSTILRGVATVFGVQAGGVAVAAAASFTPNYKTQDFSHEYEKKAVTNGDGKVIGYAAVDGLIKGKLTWTVTGSDIANARTLMEFAAKLAPVTLASFPIASLNHSRWVCTGSKPSLAQGDHATYDLEIECSEDVAVDLSTVIT